MTTLLAVDFYNHRYDVSVPSLIIINSKFYWHRPTRRLLDRGAVDAIMLAASYTPPVTEIGKADKWVKEHLNFGNAPVIPSTSVVAGTPPAGGVFDKDIPKDLAALIALGSLGATTAWTVGQFVSLVDGTKASWNGTTWVAGAAPVAGPISPPSATPITVSITKAPNPATADDKGEITFAGGPSAVSHIVTITIRGQSAVGDDVQNVAIASGSTAAQAAALVAAASSDPEVTLTSVGAVVTATPDAGKVLAKMSVGLV